MNSEFNSLHLLKESPIPFIFLISGFIMFSWTAYSGIEITWLFILSLFMLFTIIVTLYFILTIKITIKEDLIIRTTLFNKKQIKFKEIKTLLVYETYGKGGIHILTESDLLKSSFFGLRFIVLSYQENYKPQSFNQKDTIRIPYQKEIYNIFKEKL